MTVLPRRSAAILLTAAGLALLAACERSPTAPVEEPSATQIRLTIGSQVVTVAGTGAVTGGPISLPLGATAISAEFLLASGAPDPVVAAPHYRLDVTSRNPGIVTFERTGAFQGTLVATQGGPAQLDVSLFGVSHNHAEFGPFPLPVSVEQDPR
jgi:hypothetical protein